MSGLPIATYFSVYKLMWMLEHVPAVAEAVADGRAAFGTIDSWLIYNLTGGGVHVTDVTNASRTGLMDLRTCTWHAPTAEALGVPLHVLPTIKSNAEVYGHVVGGPLAGVPICGCLGDQQAATLGQRCRVGACVRAPRARQTQLTRASLQARRRTHTAQAVSCCSTPGLRWCILRMVSYPQWLSSWGPLQPRRMHWRAAWPSPAQALPG